MRYCPNCEKPYPDEAYKCPDCGYSPEAEQDTEATAIIPVPVAPVGTAVAAPHAETPPGGEVTGQGSKFYKNPVWLALAAAVIVIAIVGGILLYLHSRSGPVTATNTSTTPTATTDTGVKAYQDNLTKSWNTLRDITVELVKKDSEVVDQASLNTFTALLTVSSDKIEQTRNEMGRLQVPDDYKLRHQNLVDAVVSYRDYLKSLLIVTGVDPAKVNAADFEPVNTLGEDAQKKVVASEKQLAFLRALPDECFILHTTLNTFYTAIWQKPQTQTPRTPATPAQPTGNDVIAAERGLTDSTAGGFSSAYVSADYGNMETYLYGGGGNFQINYAVPPYSWEYGDATGRSDTVRIIYLFATDDPTVNYLEDWELQIAYVNSNVYIVNATLITSSDFFNN